MSLKVNRRQFVAGASAVVSVAAARHSFASIPSDEAWARAADIARKISRSRHSSAFSTSQDFGARADGTTLNTDAIARAIAACAKEGGGRVVVPAGRFLTGAIRLKSNVELHVSEGATLLFDTESVELSHGVHALGRHGAHELLAADLRARREEHRHHRQGHARRAGQRRALVGMEGAVGRHHAYGWNEGMPDQRPARKKLFDMAEAGVPVKDRVFGDGSLLRPPFIQPYRLRERADRGRAPAQFAVLEHSSRCCARTSSCAAWTSTAMGLTTMAAIRNPSITC